MKKYVQAGYEETVGLAGVYDKIVYFIYDELAYTDMFDANSIRQAIPEYDPDWCEEEYNEHTGAMLKKAAMQYARAAADILLANKK